MMLAALREDDPCQAVLPVQFSDSHMECLPHTSFITILFYWEGRSVALPETLTRDVTICATVPH